MAEAEADRQRWAAWSLVGIQSTAWKMRTDGWA